MNVRRQSLCAPLNACRIGLSVVPAAPILVLLAAWFLAPVQAAAVQPAFQLSDLLGFQTDGMQVRVVNGGSVPNIDIAEQILASGSLVGNGRGLYSVVNFGGGSFSGGVSYPSGTNSDNFAFEANGLLHVPTAGSYVLGINSDDGFRLRVGTDLQAVSQYYGGTGDSNTRVVVTFDQAGLVPYKLTHFENGGGQFIEFYARPGTDTSFTTGSPGDYRLIGDTANGGLQTIATGQFFVRDVKSSGTVGNLAAVDAMLRGDTAPQSQTPAFANVVDYFDTGSAGRFGANNAFPGATAADDEDFGIEATAMVYIAEAGTYTFGNNSDDGARIQAQGVRVVNADQQQGTTDAFGTMTFEKAGFYDLRYTYFERGGGASAELFAAKGVHTAWDADAFRLVGDVAAGGLAVYSPKGWLADASGSWSSAANWRDSQIAGGADAFATFSLVDLSANRTVTIGDSETVTMGHVRFGDVDVTGGPHGWTVAGAGTLELIATTGQPVLDVVNSQTTIEATLSADNGFEKQGGGTLLLAGTQTYTGNATVGEGVLAIASTDALPGWNAAGRYTVAEDAALIVGNSVTDADLADMIATGNYQAGAGAGFLTAGGNRTFNGVLTDTSNGALVLVKGGEDTLELTGANTYTGGTVVREGTLSLGAADALPADTVVTLGGGGTGGTLRLNGYSQQFRGLQTAGAGGAASQLVNGSSTAATLTVDVAAGVLNRFAGTLGGSGTDENNFDLVKQGQGTLVLSGANTYSGGTTVDAGILAIMTTAALPGWSSNGSYTVASGAALAVGSGVSDADVATILGTTNLQAGAAFGFHVDAGATRVFAGQVVDTPNGALPMVKIGGGTLSLTAENAYTGGTMVREGTVQLGVANALPTGSVLTLGQGGTSGMLRLNGFNQQLAGLVIDGTAGTANRVVNGSSTAAAITLDIAAGQTGTFAGMFGGNASNENNLSVVKQGEGTFRLGAASTHTGGTTVREGTLSLGVANALPTSSTVTLGGDGTSGTFALNGYSQQLGRLAIAGTAGADNRVINGSSTAATLTLSIGSGQTQTFGGTLGGPGANENNFSLLKSGAGTLVLSAANTYTGGTTIRAGTVQLGRANALPAGSAVTLGYDDTSSTNADTSGTLALNGFDQQVREIRVIRATGAANRVINGSATPATLAFDTAAGAYTRFTGTLGGTTDTDNNFGLTKQGAGVLQLTQPGQYTGDTVVAAGTLQLGLAAGMDGAKLWLDANSGNVITNESGGVTQWLDQSGNGRNATAAGATNAVATTNTLVNDMGVVRFNGTDQHFGVDLSFLANSGYTILAVEGRTGTGNHYYLGTYNASATNQALHVGYRSDTQYTLAQYSNDLNVSVGSYANQQFRVWANMLNLTTNQQAIYRDGALLGSRNAGGALTAADGGRLGTGFSSQWFNGDLGEILIFDRALNASERAFVEEYLMLRWLNGGSPLDNILPTDTNLLVGGSATFDLGGTNQTVASLADYAGGGGTVSDHAAGSSVLTIAGGATTQFSGVLADGPGGGVLNLTHSGTGALALTGDNTYSGTTTVTNGSLLVNGTHVDAGQYLVSGGTLGGTGSIGGATTIAAGGTLAPGVSIGAMEFTETLSLEDDATLRWEFLATGTPGQQYDTIHGTDLILPESGTVSLNILGLDGYTLEAGDSFTLFDGDVYQGATLLAEGTDISHLFSIGDNIGWWGSWQVTAGSLVLTAVPEPGTWLLLLSALALLLGRRRRW